MALGVFHRNHGNIIVPGPGDDAQPLAQQDEWRDLLVQALTVETAQYPELLAKCDALTARTFAEGIAGSNPDWYNQYQHVVFRVRDQFGGPVNDYVVEFYQEHGDPDDQVFQAMHRDIIASVTTNSTASNYRSFTLSTDSLRGFLVSRPGALIDLSVTAANLSDLIRYRNPSGGSSVFSLRDQRYILPNDPVLVDVVIPRDQAPEVFTLDRGPA